MSHPGDPEPVKFFCGILTPRKEILQEIFLLLSSNTYEIEDESPWFEFIWSQYYEKEMGGPLYKKLVSFIGLQSPDRIVEFKLFSYQIEKQFCSPSPPHGRIVNLDPGYLHTGQVLLTSFKHAGYRVYLRRGVYAEVELLYRNKSWNPLPWTYPDYRTEDYRTFFTKVRKTYLGQRRQWLKSKNRG